jgi:hypothetical protein
MILRCTQRLLKGSGIQLTPEPRPEPAALGEWFANAVPLPMPGRWVVMYTNARTLLTVLTAGRVIRTTLPAFRERLPRLLARLRLPPDWIDAQAAALDLVYFARTNDRRVLGSMNDFAGTIQYEIQHFGPGWFNLDRMELRLADDPMTFLDYHDPERVTRALALGKTPEALRDEKIAELRRLKEIEELAR